VIFQLSRRSRKILHAFGATLSLGALAAGLHRDEVLPYYALLKVRSGFGFSGPVDETMAPTGAAILSVLAMAISTVCTCLCFERLRQDESLQAVPGIADAAADGLFREAMAAPCWYTASSVIAMVFSRSAQECIHAAIATISFLFAILSLNVLASVLIAGAAGRGVDCSNRLFWGVWAGYACAVVLVFYAGCLWWVGISAVAIVVSFRREGLLERVGARQVRTPSDGWSLR